MGEGTAAVQPQPMGAEHELQFQWAMQPRRPRWQWRHLPQTGLQPQSGAAVVQVTGVVQPQDLPESQLEQKCLPKTFVNGPQQVAQ